MSQIVSLFLCVANGVLSAKNTAPLARGCGFGKRSQIVRRLRRLARGGEHRPVVVAKQVEPIFDIPGVTKFAGDPEVHAEERRGQFLGGISPRAEARR